ncbi:MAG: HEAT repeat domain-containing protein [Planctomycetales bacterium]|nr:HEAT repeat domain-containing protein [Planctomycetales bacterium]
MPRFFLSLTVCFSCCWLVCSLSAQDGSRQDRRRQPQSLGPQEEDYTSFGIYEQTAPHPSTVTAQSTNLPLAISRGQTIALIGNTLFERSAEFGHFEAYLQAAFPDLHLRVRNLAWSADALDTQPRPDNFANTFQHLTHERADIVFAAFGFNESFEGENGLQQFRTSLTDYLQQLKTKAFNGSAAPQVVLVSPIANENVPSVNAGSRNNERIGAYVDVMREVAAEQQVGFVDVFNPTAQEMASPGSDLTVNGIHLNAEGNQLFSQALFRGVFSQSPPVIDDSLLAAVVDKDRQYFRRFRPLNTFYYTGGRNKDYGYLDFLPAMRNFDIMVANREQRIWDLVAHRPVADRVDDSNVPPLPKTIDSRGANEWLSAEDELKAFQVDPRFEVNLFAGEEQFPDIAAPIQMRWDSRGRLWVSCSTTYPHVYPGNEPNDKLVILEDVDGDGRADKSTVFADNLHIPLSFELGDGGVYVSEAPQIAFLQDTDGDDRADVRIPLLSGFGTEDSHHALHDFTWTPDGDLLFRESIFHHSQVETPYGPIRQQNSGWFRFSPRSQRLISFGSYHSTNPWGVTFDDWGQHMASHPVYAAAFHSLDPRYPEQHPAPKDLQAYSGVCGHEFVDFATFPEELQGGFIKVRYKPTNRVEMHRWKQVEFGFEEEYIGDLLFSTNLSFIPVDLKFGPRGALYVCDWYNPVKGHMQYSLRDERRDRHSGRIWRITAKDMPVQEPPDIAGASVGQLLDLLKRPEYRYRKWTKQELRERDPVVVRRELDAWTKRLDPTDPRFRHHQLEALWTYRWLGDADLAHTAWTQTELMNGNFQLSDDNSREANPAALELLQELLQCEQPMARAAATQQLRYWHWQLPDAIRWLRTSANDASSIVRMESAIAASYIGTPEALEAMLDIAKYPRDGHLAYAIRCALGSRTLKPLWVDNPTSTILGMLKDPIPSGPPQEPRPNRREAEFDRQANLKLVEVSAVPERMLFSVNQIAVQVGQPVKIVFVNEDATDHNLVIVQPDAMAEVGMAANEMARDPRNAASDFLPPDKADLIIHATPMIGPMRGSRIAVMRFNAPQEAGVYPFLCTFPGHWVVMNGLMIVAEDLADVDAMLAAHQPPVVRQWQMLDFHDLPELDRPANDEVLMAGMQAFVKARCHQCHVVAGHGVNLGPDLVESVKKLRGTELLQQILEPSKSIHQDFQTQKFLLDSGIVVTGVIVREDDEYFHVATNLLTPNTVTAIRKSEVELKSASTISAMPTGLLDILSREEILALLTYLEHGGALPAHMQHKH